MNTTADESSTSLELKLADLVVDPALQPRRGGLSLDHLQSLAETVDAWPPLTVVEHDDRYVLVDGFHRHAAADGLGLEAIRIAVVAAPADGDLRGLAFELNRGHGRALTLADRRAEALRRLKRTPELSSRSIAKACGLSHVTVEKLRSEAAASGQIDQSELREGAGGYSYRAPERKPGELPAEGVGESLKTGLTGLVGRREAAQARRAVSYLRRVTVALGEQFRLPDWSPEALAQAALAQLDEAEAALLGAELGVGAVNLLRAAELLGYEPEPDDG